VKRLTALMLIMPLAACGDDRPPAPNAEEAARLDETEAMLNNVAETQEGPETRAPGPSNRSD
jgi:predicted small lipoprotein YifL